MVTLETCVVGTPLCVGAMHMEVITLAPDHVIAVTPLGTRIFLSRGMLENSCALDTRELQDADLGGSD